MKQGVHFHLSQQLGLDERQDVGDAELDGSALPPLFPSTKSRRAQEIGYIRESSERWVMQHSDFLREESAMRIA